MLFVQSISCGVILDCGNRIVSPRVC